MFSDHSEKMTSEEKRECHSSAGELQRGRSLSNLLLRSPPLRPQYLLFGLNPLELHSSSHFTISETQTDALRFVSPGTKSGEKQGKREWQLLCSPG